MSSKTYLRSPRRDALRRGFDAAGLVEPYLHHPIQDLIWNKLDAVGTLVNDGRKKDVSHHRQLVNYKITPDMGT